MSTTTQSLASRLSSLSDQNRTILQLIQRLSDLKSQPGSTPLEGGDGDVRVELSSEIHENLKQQEEELELLRQETEELGYGVQGKGRGNSERDRDRSRLGNQVAKLGEDLQHARSYFRKAQLRAKRSAETTKQKERELLFASIQEGRENGAATPVSGRRRGNDKLTQEEIVANASSDVTAALRRTHQLMQGELSRSQFAQETLEQGTAALNELSTKYTDLTSLLSNSRNLLSTLVRSQKSDTWYLQTALYILVTTIIWLIFRRLLYGPLWWLVYLPIKLSYRTFITLLSAAGLVGGSAATTSVASTASPSRTLIVHPSAGDDEFPRFSHAPGQGRVYMPVGGGGSGAKVAPDLDANPELSMSQRVAEMAEAAKTQAAGQQQQQQNPQQPQEGGAGSARKEEENVVRRGDGTILEDRGEVPKNMKKKMFEADVENEKERERRQRDEL